MTVTVSDGSLTASESFVITVNPVNTAPSLSALTNRSMDAGSTTAPIAFTVADLETALSDLAVSAATSNATLLPVSGISYSVAAAPTARFP
jgi:hypothetical protein